MENGFNEYLEFQVNRHSNRLSRGLLNFLEDIRAENEQNIARLKYIIPEEFHSCLDQANVFDENKMQHLRKRILDNGGDFTRDILAELDHYEVQIKFNNKAKGK